MAPAWVTPSCIGCVSALVFEAVTDYFSVKWREYRKEVKVRAKAERQLELALESGALEKAILQVEESVDPPAHVLEVKEKLMTDLLRGLQDGSLSASLRVVPNGLTLEETDVASGGAKVRAKLHSQLLLSLNSMTLSSGLQALSGTNGEEWQSVKKQLQDDLAKGLEDGHFRVCLRTGVPKEELLEKLATAKLHFLQAQKEIAAVVRVTQ